MKHLHAPPTTTVQATMQATALALLLALGFVAVSPPVAAQQLDPAHYIDLSIERLQLARDSWTHSGQPPATADLAALFARYGIDETGYLIYTSNRRKAIDHYLSAHPDARQRIDALGSAIQQAIEDQAGNQP